MKKKPQKRLKYTIWRKLSDGNFYPFVVLYYKDLDDKQKKLEAKLETYTNDEVLRVRNELKEDLIIKQNQQKYGVPDNLQQITFEQVSVQWLKYKSRHVRPYTVKRYKSVLDNHILPILKDFPIQVITRKQITNIIEILCDKKQIRSAQFAHRILSNFCKFAIKESFIEVSPFQEIDCPTYHPPQIQILTKAEAKIFLELAKNTKHELLFKFALITGMRPEEYLALKWTDVDFENKIVMVQRSVDLNIPETVNFQDVKSKNSRRSIPLSQSLWAKLKAMRKAESEKKYEFDYDLVFCCENGKPLRLNNLTNRHFKPIIKKIDKDKDLSLYSLRHTCATLLMLAGENPKVVAERLGNSVSVTLKTYSHVSPNMQKTASEKLEAMFK
jgi:integrase